MPLIDPHQLDEARAIQQLADRQPLITGLVASGRPEHAGFAAHLDALPDVKGRALRNAQRLYRL